jgi:hypothetical protein
MGAERSAAPIRDVEAVWGQPAIVNGLRRAPMLEWTTMFQTQVNHDR